MSTASALCAVRQTTTRATKRWHGTPGDVARIAKSQAKGGPHSPSDSVRPRVVITGYHVTSVGLPDEGSVAHAPDLARR